MNSVICRTARFGVPALLLTVAAGCSTPFEREATKTLRESIIESADRELVDAWRSPEPRTLESPPSEVTFSEDRLKELEAMAGPNAYPKRAPEMGPDLLGEATETFRIDLQQAIRSSVENNLSLQIARVTPAITEAQVVAAQGAFDWVFFASYDWLRQDQPGTMPVVGGVPVGVGGREAQINGYETGIRKQLVSGGQLTISQGLTQTDARTPGIMLSPNPANESNINIRLDQPLLRDFGADVALAEIRLSRNIERAAILDLKRTMINVVTDTERAYWNLVQSWHNLRILRRVLERGIVTRDVLKARLDFDVRPAEYSDAVATVERRRADVIRAENIVRLSSDRLKALMNDSGLTVGSETLLVPVDTYLREPVEFSLLDAVMAGLDDRPEVQQAILAIDNTSIRSQVASNARLPQLDLTLQTTIRGLDETFGSSYDELTEAKYVDFLVGVFFEQALGNRSAEAFYRQRQLERLQATIGYRQTVQEVVLQIKVALRELSTNYALLTQTAGSRLAATENLRTLEVQEQTIQSLTPSFLDLKLRRQEALAQAELDEVQAMTTYNVALAELYRAIGTALERNQIRFVVPDAGDFSDEIASR